MDAPTRRFESVLAWASWLIVAGLGVQVATCFSVGAPSFILFIVPGGLLVGAGSCLFLYWLATSGGSDGADSREG